ncbi:MAG: GWxTD domain-containing protein, partial [Bacteroidota bacterium]|nr:GWxTD domain-containing protein [Bacteroidota bacterium]
YDLVPYVYNFFPVTEEKLSFYCELYNIDKSVGDGQKFALSYYVESFENNIQFPDMARIRKETARPVNVVLAEFNIHSLPTGNYNIVVEARNPNNEVIATKKVFFQRSNPTAQISYTEMLTNSPANTFVDRIINLDSLREYISCTFPISSGIERAFIKNALKTSDLKSMQEYFLGFWLRRDPNNPEKAWIAYKAQVDKAQANFGTKIKKGYQTDRGRVYLEYGAPNVRSTQYNEPNSYPYEIWQYYSMTNNNQRNRKFVFYSPDMVTSDFFLLHSDAIGEVNNPHWMIDLQGRTYSPSNVQDNDQLNNWGGFAKDYWDLPN